MKICFTALVATLLTSGCGDRTNDLEQKCSRLTNGLDSLYVSNLFSEFPIIANAEHEFFVPYKGSMVYQSNQAYASYVIYGAKKGSHNDPLWNEWCQIWFDTNGIIMGYKYQLGD